MIARELIRKLGLKLKAAAGRDDNALIDITAKDALAIAEVLTTPTWFMPEELECAARASNILELTKIDAWTLRDRLDEFGDNCDKTGHDLAYFSAGAFAAFLKTKGSTT